MNLKLVDDVSWQILAVLMPSVRLILQLGSSAIITDAVIFSRTHNKNATTLCLWIKFVRYLFHPNTVFPK